jgi:hypothetical protein
VSDTWSLAKIVRKVEFKYYDSGHFASEAVCCAQNDNNLRLPYRRLGHIEEAQTRGRG